MTQKEFGGYLPLELGWKKEYFDAYGKDVLRLDCGRNALRTAVTAACAKKVYLPVYTCDTVYEAVAQTGVEIVPYRIGENWMPLDAANLAAEPDSWLVYTNYFGVVEPASIEQLRAVCPRLIFDNTQAFFSSPVMSEDCYSVYSCRKFFGVSDGAYLLGRGLGQRELTFPSSTSWQTAGQLLKSIECGTNGAYAESKQNENQLADHPPRTMSPLTRRILQSVDYKEVAARRRANFAALHRLLGGNNPLQFWTSSDTAMSYPFYCEKPGLRAELIAHKVYASQLWPWVLDKVEETSFEARLSNYLMPLPIDQRYTVNDMVDLAELVKSLAE